jgi:hypothetical protein
MKRILLLSAIAVSATLRAQTPTWADNVSCIFYSHCTGCHHPGGIGGEQLDLTGYTVAFSNRDDIAAYTAARVMPPWPPDPNYRRFAHERTLTQEEIDIIAAWAAADGPQGDLANAPPVPTYNDAPVITNPDITSIMETYTVPDLATDLYRCFILPINNPTDKWIKRLEVIPGDPSVVHHVLVYQDTSGYAHDLDDADPGLGYTMFSDVGVPTSRLIGIWVPGADLITAPEGMGFRLQAGAELIIQVHYPAGSGNHIDSTRINLAFIDDPNTREITIDPLLDHDYGILDGPLSIPPNQVRTFHTEFVVPEDLTITHLMPHAHLTCTHMRAFASIPGQGDLPLVDLEWDFHWQSIYAFKHPLFLPEGTILRGEATYDNTTANLQNPNHANPQQVDLGFATTDEMMLFYFGYLPGDATDTNIVVDGSDHGAHYLDCEAAVGVKELARVDVRVSPVPATDVLSVRCAQSGCILRLLDMRGSEVLRNAVGSGERVVDVSSVARGVMLAEVRDSRGAVLYRSRVILQ